MAEHLCAICGAKPANWSRSQLSGANIRRCKACDAAHAEPKPVIEAVLLDLHREWLALGDDAIELGQFVFDAIPGRIGADVTVYDVGELISVTDWLKLTAQRPVMTMPDAEAEDDDGDDEEEDDLDLGRMNRILDRMPALDEDNELVSRLQVVAAQPIPQRKSSFGPPRRALQVAVGMFIGLLIKWSFPRLTFGI